MDPNQQPAFPPTQNPNVPPQPVPPLAYTPPIPIKPPKSGKKLVIIISIVVIVLILAIISWLVISSSSKGNKSRIPDNSVRKTSETHLSTYCFDTELIDAVKVNDKPVKVFYTSQLRGCKSQSAFQGSTDFLILDVEPIKFRFSNLDQLEKNARDQGALKNMKISRIKVDGKDALMETGQDSGGLPRISITTIGPTGLASDGKEFSGFLITGYDGATSRPVIDYALEHWHWKIQ